MLLEARQTACFQIKELGTTEAGLLDGAGDGQVLVANLKVVFGIVAVVAVGVWVLSVAGEEDIGPCRWEESVK